MTTYQEDMDEMLTKGCADPSCGEVHNEMYLHAQCHLHSYVEAAYNAATGTLKVSCAECHKPIAELAIAHRPKS